MKFTIQDDTTFKTIISCIKTYRFVKRCFKDEPDNYSIKGITLHLGEREEKELVKEFEKELSCNDE